MTKEERTNVIDFLYDDINRKSYETYEQWIDRLISFDDNEYEVLCPYEDYKILCKKICNLCLDILSSKYTNVLTTNRFIKCCLSLQGLLQYDMKYLEENQDEYYRLNYSTLEHLYPLFSLLLPISIDMAECVLDSIPNTQDIIGLGNIYFKHQEVKSYVADDFDGDVDILNKYAETIKQYNSLMNMIDMFFKGTAEMLTREIGLVIEYFLNKEAEWLKQQIDECGYDVDINNERINLGLRGKFGYDYIIRNYLPSNALGRCWLQKSNNKIVPCTDLSILKECILSFSYKGRDSECDSYPIASFKWGRNENDVVDFIKYIYFLAKCNEDMNPPNPKGCSKKNEVFDSEAAQIYWNKLIAEGFCDNEHHWIGGSANTAAYVAIKFNKALLPDRKNICWQYFETMWGIKNMKNSDCATGRSYPARAKDIDSLFE